MSRHTLAVLGGTDYDPVHLRVWAQAADRLVAADSGADRLLAAGFVPDLIVGDMDSLSEAARRSGAPVLEDKSQDTNDCEKLLAHLSGPAVVACVEGDRLDHVLATLGACLRADPPVRLLLRGALGLPVRAGVAAGVRAEPGKRAALMPMLPCTGVWFQGVRWPLENAVLDPLGLVSSSNEVTAELVQARVLTGAAWLLVEGPEETPSW